MNSDAKIRGLRDLLQRLQRVQPLYFFLSYFNQILRQIFGKYLNYVYNFCSFLEWQI